MRLPCGELLKKEIALDGTALVGEGLNQGSAFVFLRILIRLLFFFEVITSQDFPLPVIAHFDKLTG